MRTVFRAYSLAGGSYFCLHQIGSEYKNVHLSPRRGRSFTIIQKVLGQARKLTPLIPILGKQRREALCKCEASLTNIAGYRLVRATR